jgi:uncharacterized protein YndB with AHSA1/START domain/DNA-binding transcriptional ArsR family regulator
VQSAGVIENRVFQALADPSRRAIFESLTRGEAAVKTLTTRFDISQPAVSQHLAALKDAGLVTGRREGRCVYYRVEPRGIKAAHRLDRALPRLLDGTRGSPGTPAGDNGRMTLADTTARSQTDTIAFELDLPHPPEKVWRALTDPALLAEWLLPTVGFALERGTAFSFRTQPVGGWDGVVQCRLVEIEAPTRLSYTWVVGDMAIDTVVTFTLTPTASGTRLTLVQSGFKPDQKQNFGGARYGWRMMGGRLIDLLGRIP